MYFEKGNVLKFIDKYYMAIMLFFSAVWFGPLLRKGFVMGDCVRLLNTFKYSDEPFKLAFADFGVYRPVFFCTIVLLMRIIGYNYAAYFWFSVLLNAITAYVIYRKINKRTSTLLLGIASSIAYTVAIYSYYGITQIYGIMEQMCVLFAVCFFDEMIGFVEKEDKCHFIRAVFYFGLALFTHERFLVLFGVFFFQILFFSFNKNIKKKIFYILIATLPMDIFIFFKKIIFHTAIFRGTAQTTISISCLRIAKFVFQSIASMFGFNFGASHLFGNYNFVHYSACWKTMTILALMIVCFCIFYYLYKEIIKNKNRLDEIKLLALFIFSEGGTILCYCVSDRIEMRQIYVPYVLLIMYLAYCASKIKGKEYLKWVSGVIVIATLFANGANYQKYIGDLFFMRTMSYTKSFYEKTMQQGEYELLDTQVYVYDQADLTWGIMASEQYNIYDLYWDNSDVDTIVWSDLSELESEVKVVLDNGMKVRIIYPESYDEVGEYIVNSEADLLGIQTIKVY